jgi:uncharacterized membrane protein (DUF373 family)
MVATTVARSPNGLQEPGAGHVEGHGTAQQLPPLDHAYACVTQWMYIAAIALLVGAGLFVFGYSIYRAVMQRPHTFAAGVPDFLGGVILAVIILELAHTVHEQISYKRGLTVLLVNDFLIIGAVSAVRHVLVLGAELSMGSIDVNGGVDTDLHQLEANVFLVAVLLGGMWLIRDQVAKQRKDEKATPPAGMRLPKRNSNPRQDAA